MVGQTSPRLATITRSLFFPYGSCAVKATSLFSSTIRGNCYTIGESCVCHCTIMTQYSSCYNLFYFLGMYTLYIYMYAKFYGMSDFKMKFHSSSHHRWMISDYLASSHEQGYSTQYSTIYGTMIATISSWALACLQYNVLFCRQLERSFDLFYYDGLAHQDEVIRLTIGEQ